MRDFSVLVLEGAYPTSVAATLGILGAAKTLAPRLGLAPPSWQVFSIDGGAIDLLDGISVSTTKLPRQLSTDNSVWIVPGLGLNNAKAVQQRFEQTDAQRAALAVQAHARAGGTVAASCSGVFVLQAAGLLHGKRATTSWWLAPELKRLEPGCFLDADRMVCADGNIVTAGAAFAQTDLMLHLLRTGFGNALAEAVSKILLIDGRQAQAPFIVPEVYSSGDELVGRLAAKVEAALPDLPTIGELAQAFCMSERTLSRRLKQATGKSTLALLQSVRLRRARALLESSRMTVEQVAVAVGYKDATALRRLMKKVAGANPSWYRQAS